MTFRPRQYTQILDDMISFVQAHTRLTDYTIGSVVRTTLEAAALEDDEQYFQMVQLLDVFNIRTSSGTDLDGRVADYNILRIQPSSSYGKVTIQDGSLITDTLSFDVNATGVTVALESTERFPVTGFPYIVRIGEGTVSVEEVTVSANSVGSATLTISALVNDHSIGDRASLVTGAGDIAIAPGQQVQVPAGALAAVVCVTTESGSIVNGNFESTPIAARSILPGVGVNIGVGRISQFVSAPSFTGALVTNKTIFTGGKGVESDSDLIDRALDHIQSLSKGTPLSLREAVLGVTDPVSGQRIVTSSVLEKFSTDEVIIYVDDGSGFIPDQTVLTRTALSAPYAVPTGTLLVADASELTSEGYLLVSPESAQAEVVEYSAVDYTAQQVTLVGTTVNTHDTADEVITVEVLTTSSEAAVLFYTMKKYPLVRNSFRLWVGPTADNLTLQVEGVDYYLNKARSRLEFLNPVTTGYFIACTYTFYTGLIFLAQRFINGSKDDDIAFPGTVAAGIEATVETPTIRRVTVRLSVTANEGIDSAQIAPQIGATIESYITSLGIGEDVIKSEIIERAMGVPGVYNIIVQEPTSDLSVGANELPVPTSAAGVTLVVVN